MSATIDSQPHPLLHPHRARWIVRPGIGWNTHHTDPYNCTYRIGVLFTDKDGTWEGVDIIGGVNTLTGQTSFIWDVTSHWYVKEILIYTNNPNEVIHRIPCEHVTTQGGPADVHIDFGQLEG